MLPKGVQNRPQEPPKTLLQPASCWTLLSDAFFLLFGPPGTSKIVLSLERQHDFEKLSCPPWHPKKHPKNQPTWLQKVTPEASKGPKIKLKSDAQMELQIRPIFGRFSNPKWDPNWPPKSLKNQTWPAQGPPRMLNAARKPPGSHFGAMLEPFGTNLGAILQQFDHMFF